MTERTPTRLETKIPVFEGKERAPEQSGRHEQQDSEGHLAGDQDASGSYAGGPPVAE